MQEYRIVSPVDETFVIYTLAEGKYRGSRMFTYGDIVTSGVLPGFEVDLTALFESVKK